MGKEDNKKKHPMLHLVAGGCAGFVESSVCHPLDTIKTRMQLRRQGASVEKVVVRVRNSLVEPAIRMTHSLRDPSAFMPSAAVAGAGAGGVHEPGLRIGAASAPASEAVVIKPIQQPKGLVKAGIGPIGTAQRIIQREGFMALYKGLTAVYTGIIPKMAIRFVSFEQYREWLQHATGDKGSGVTFTAGLASGLTEAILVVTPAEVCKIRMQSQYHSMIDPSQMQHRKYTNVVQTAVTIVREEGISALYKGVVPTMLRQGCNQAVNFTAYSAIKQKVMEYQNTDQLQHWQSLLIGGLSGGMGPLVNNPLDVVKTRLQKQIVHPGKEPKYTGLSQACVVIAKEEGVLALWKGITPRLLRIMPGQAITFMTYEAVSKQLNNYGFFQSS
jgi:solute carrier family 25 citrate transporter 1